MKSKNLNDAKSLYYSFRNTRNLPDFEIYDSIGQKYTKISLRELSDYQTEQVLRRKLESELGQKKPKWMKLKHLLALRGVKIDKKDPPITDSTFWRRRLDRTHYSSYIDPLLHRAPEEIDPLVSNLYRILDQETIHEGKSILKTESHKVYTNPEYEVDLSGLKVAGKYMYLVGPGISFCLLLYLTTLILHLKRNLQSREDFKTASIFPWLGLFPNLISRVLMFLSILLTLSLLQW
jgi:hypothetical protein